jgi:hypothetical protein
MMSVEEGDQKVQAVYDTIELPPVTPIVTRVTQYGGQCGQCGQRYVAPVPVGLEGGPFGTSVASRATYFRSTHAISYERLVGLVGEVVHLEISEGALANLFERVKMHLEGTTTTILERLRRAPRMKAVLLRAFVIHKRRERLADSTLYPHRCDLSCRLEAALNLHPTHPDSRNGMPL